MKPAAGGRALHPRMKLWLSTDDAEGVFGDGKWRLLSAIRRTSSLKAAAASLDISYRKAWGDLKKAERRLGVALLAKQRGGSHGGETQLTEAGRRWLAAYSRFRAEAHEAVERAFQAHLKAVIR